MAKWHWWTRDDGTTEVYYNDPRYYYVDYFDPDEGNWTTKVIPGRPPEREIPELMRWKRSSRDEISDDINWNPDTPSDAPHPIPDPYPQPGLLDTGGV
jgi:hypothetical protein